jgi:hypothetical protein
MPGHSEGVTDFIAVDFDIRSKSDLQPLVTALGDRICGNHVTREGRTYWARFSLARATKSADTAIRAFATMISTLPKAQRKLWDAAETREFDIGVQAAMEPFCYEMLLSAEVVDAVARLNARIRFTVYAPEVPRKIARKQRPSSPRPGSNACCVVGQDGILRGD